MVKVLLASLFLLFLSFFRTDGCVLQGIDRFSSKEALSRSWEAPQYRYLGKGRQSFVFESVDGTHVLKLFNRRWFDPFLSFSVKRKEGRRERTFDAYRLAEEKLSLLTGILYLHLEESKDLPTVSVEGPGHFLCSLDLNQVPFVLQKKGTLLSDQFEEKSYGEQVAAMDLFFRSIEERLKLGIVDLDVDMVVNFGMAGGLPLLIDPGRIFFDATLLRDRHRMEVEIERSCRRFRRFCQKKAPHLLASMDERERAMKERLL